MDNAWLLVYDFYDGPHEYLICSDKTDALEMFMSLVEEEMFECFYNICQDKYEDINQDWEDSACWRVSPYDSLWCVLEVPVINGDTCC